MNKKWRSILNVECYDPPPLRGKMLDALSWKVLSSDNTCSDPEEEEICPQTEHVDSKDDLDKELSIVPPPAAIM